MSSKASAAPAPGQFMGALLADIRTCEAHMHETDDQMFWRRMLVRCLFAFIEGDCAVWRFIASNLFCKYGSDQILISRLALLQDTDYRTDNTGQLEPMSQRIATKQYIAFVLRSAAIALKVDANCNSWFADDGFAKFQLAIKVRDRITHPKTSTDLEIPPEDMIIVRTAFSWYLNTVRELMKALPSGMQVDQFRLVHDKGLGLALTFVKASYYGSAYEQTQPKSSTESANQ